MNQGLTKHYENAAAAAIEVLRYLPYPYQYLMALLADKQITEVESEVLKGYLASIYDRK